MAAGFSGLFHAPLAAVCFALEVLAVGKLEYRALLPASLAAITANAMSAALGLESFQVALPACNLSPLSPRILLLGVAAGIIGGLFTVLLQYGKKQAAKWFPNPLIRIAVCGTVLAVLLGVCGTGRYTGLGTNLITLACTDGTVYSFDFLCKLLFTVLTLSIGFQGGEVTPLFAIGACLGTALAPILGIDRACRCSLLCCRIRQCIQYITCSDLHWSRSIWLCCCSLFCSGLHACKTLQWKSLYVRETDCFSSMDQIYDSRQRFTIKMPTQTKTNASIPRIPKELVSFRKIPESTTPQMGFKKPNTVTFETGLYLSSKAHIE